MALSGEFADEEYQPEYGTLLVRDSCTEYVPPEPGEELLEESAVGAQPGGTLARAGTGWLEGHASDAYHRVRLEAHDARPPDDRAGLGRVPPVD